MCKVSSFFFLFLFCKKEREKRKKQRKKEKEKTLIKKRQNYASAVDKVFCLFPFFVTFFPFSLYLQKREKGKKVKTVTR